ncbi:MULTISPECIES: AbfB domain-containing protein [unclassified Streptomyces]|uniref:AbfB domain-containing protein n=1 Tax=unclassified Streptomyces TaxID=2593676 RepID=UPI000B870DA1|nr:MULTISPECIES: AbfB domain-containing protein [unclassified Streptomyces]PKW07048.1 alpha-L-arabinofuranosidase B-like protein [Streptomyces sp. 5112.2]
MPENSPLPPEQQPAADEPPPGAPRSRRRRLLWPVGALVLAAVATGVTVTAVHGRTPESRTAPAANGAPADGAPAGRAPGDGSPDPRPSASVSTKASAPAKGRGHPSPAAPRAAESPVLPAGDPTPTPAKSPFRQGGSPKATGGETAVRSLNHPGDYWHLSGDDVKIGPLSSAAARRAATFRLVKGLANGRCYSFATVGGGYLRVRDGLLRAGDDDGSRAFERDATFCPRPSAFAGGTSLESAAHSGRFLRHDGSRLRLDPYRNTDPYRADSAFLLVDKPV